MKQATSHEKGGGKMKIVVDGNDGTGKSTLVASLVNLGYEVQDRGDATKMTDDPTLAPSTNVFYIVLDAPVAVCRERLAAEGRDLTEKYHTVEDLTYYRERFLEVAKRLPRATLVDASGTPEQVLKKALEAIRSTEIVP